MEIEYCKHCECGAYSVDINGQTYCMSREKCIELLGVDPVTIAEESKYYACNSCVNNWNVEMCACGSGEPFQTCDGGSEVCGRPMQELHSHTYVCAKIDYNKCSDTEFDEILTKILDEKPGKEILAIPGAYEVFSEHFNNEVLGKWEEINPPKPVYAITWDLIERPGTPLHGLFASSGIDAAPSLATIEVELTDIFRLKDGDGEIYFIGRMDKWTAENEPFAPLDNYGRGYGCTSIEILEDGSWTEV